jgi:hypothetical protein
MNNGWVLPGLLVVIIGAAVGLLALRKHRRRQALERAAEGLGLRYAEGDPLGLGRGLNADVSETIWGRFEGADVAVATASRASTPDHESRETGSVGVSLKIKVVRGLEVAQQAAGPDARVALMSDGRLAVRPQIPRQRSASSLDPDDLPDLLHATARAIRSQYW